ncbi:MAG: YdcF family protein [Pyrinomonadaceae bacterium]
MRLVIQLLLAGIAALIMWVAIAPLLARWLVVEKPLRHVDVIIVLSGSTAYLERTERAAELYRQGVAPRVFLTNDGDRAGWSQTEQTNLPFVELARRELIARDVPDAAITILPGQVSGTDSEAAVLTDASNVSGIQSVVIVTSAYHTRRSLRVFQRTLGEGVEVGIAHSPITEESPPPEFWWLRPNGWTAVAGEYVKSAVYYAYY